MPSYPEPQKMRLPKERSSGGGRGGGGGKGKAGKGRGRGGDAAQSMMGMDDGSIQQESSIEILRAQRAAARKGKKDLDDVREDHGVDEEDPLINVDDGIRIEPFNMRREMQEGHFDDAGCYVTNMEEEKKVTDAWLDTVDQAERTATFIEVGRKRKAKELEERRMKVLGKAMEGFQDEDDDDKDEAEKKDEQAAEKKDEPEEADEPEELVLGTLETLVSELLPLESPNQALARWRRWTGGEMTSEPALPALKLRKTRRQAQEKAAEAKRAAAAKVGDNAPKEKRRRLNEFGDYEMTATTPSLPVSSFLSTEEVVTPTVVPSAATTGTSEEAPTANNNAADADATSITAVAGSTSTVAGEGDLKAAAEKVVAADKSVAEAAAAAAVDSSRVTRHAARRPDGDTEGDRPEVKAVLTANTEVPRSERLASTNPTEKEEDRRSPSPLPMRAAETAKRRAGPNDTDKERRERILKLTDLCDRLLERGVLVYDSTRELLAIEVTQRKREKAEAEASQTLKHWTVEIDKTGGGALAMGCEDPPDGVAAALVVDAIDDEGLVAKYNKDHPETAIRKGDLILSVNGRKIAPLIGGEFRKDQVLSISVAREATSQASKPWTVEIDKTGGGALAMDCSNPPAGVEAALIVDAIDDSGLVAKYNKEHPETSIQTGDLILSVNDKKIAPLIGGEFRKDQILNICLSRGAVTSGTIPATATQALNKWSVEIDKTDGGALAMGCSDPPDGVEAALIVDSIEEVGLVAKHNKEHPETAIQPGDLILSVNDRKIGPSIGAEFRKDQVLKISLARKEVGSDDGATGASPAKDLAVSEDKANSETPAAASAAPAKAPEVMYRNGRLASTSNSTAPVGGLLGLLEASGKGAVVDSDVPVSSASSNVLSWQIRWAESPNEAHGPFDSVTMQGWVTQGCFCEERMADVRQCDSANKPLETVWHRWDEINFKLYR